MLRQIESSGTDYAVGFESRGPATELLVDSDQYYRRLREDVAAARESVLAQALSFEGDSVGLGMGNLLLSSRASDRRVVIDSFTRHCVNDRLVWAPANFFDRGLRSEVRATKHLIERLRTGGVGVRFTGAVGPFLTRLPARNHKKLVAIDGRVAYFGGINFSEHNFLWHDLMLRTEDPVLVGFLTEDFNRTWNDKPRAMRQAAAGVVLVSLDGESNEEAFAPVFALIEGAKTSIFVECPYITDPFLQRLAAARRRGVRITAVTPERNNFGLCRDAMVFHARNSGFDVRFYPGRMTHMKALLVDDRTLVVGSANFDAFSYRFQQEFLAIVTDPRLVHDFRIRVVEEDLRRSKPCVTALGPLAASWTRARLVALDRLSAQWRRALPRAPRR